MMLRRRMTPMRWCVGALGLLLWVESGCNTLGVDHVSGTRGHIAVVTGTLALDTDVTARGALVHIVVAPPLQMLGCVTTNTETTYSRAAVVTTQKAQLVAIADSGWVNTTGVFTCQIYVPVQAIAGAYYDVTVTRGEVSDMPGNALPVTTYNGWVHVTA